MRLNPVPWIKSEASEAKEAGKELWHAARTHNYKKSARQSLQRKYWVWWIVGIILLVCVGLISYYRDTIVSKFQPHKASIANYPGSWVIPIIILVVLSFPPLGGHEIVILVIGLVWGLWIGFAITCAGTFIGEILCYIAFKYFFTKKASEIEQESVFYACIARLMREGGLWIICVVRFSAVPGHVVTAIQSTVGMGVWLYSIAVIISLPKQLAVVLLGVGFGSTVENSSPAEVQKEKIISLSVFFGTALATVLALYIVYMRARRLYSEILQESNERKRLAIAHNIADPSHPSSSSFEGPFDDSFRTTNASLGELHSGSHVSIPMAHTGGGGDWQDGHARGERGWSEIERREREQVEREREKGTYGETMREEGEREGMGSFTHLPLGDEEREREGRYKGQKVYGTNGAGAGAGAGGR